MRRSYSNRAYYTRKFRGYPYTDVIAYLFHQQGAGGAAEFLRTGNLRYPEQSEASVSRFVRAYQDFSEGLGRTV